MFDGCAEPYEPWPLWVERSRQAGTDHCKARLLGQTGKPPIPWAQPPCGKFENGGRIVAIDPAALREAAAQKSELAIGAGTSP